jgi:hypothetical protein
MSFPLFVDCQPAINDADLDEVESVLGFVLPQDLRKHYLKYNGGKPRPNCYPFEDDFYEVRDFCSIKYGGDHSLVGWYRLMGDAIPKGMIPFSFDSANCHYCYSVRKETMHSVCYWNDGYYAQSSEDITVIAPSLHDFLSAFIRHPYTG